MLLALAFSALVAVATTHGFPAGLWRDIAHDTILGAYADTPYAGVLNGSLWSLRWEMSAYGFVLVFGMLGFLAKPLRTSLWLLAALGLLILDPLGIFVFHGNHSTFSVAFVLAEFIAGMLRAVNYRHLTVRHGALVAVLALAGLYVPWQPVQQWLLLLPPAALVLLVSIIPLIKLPDMQQDLSVAP